jgi:hypothetical protein
MALSVTKPSVVSLVHFQNATSSVIVWDLSFCFCSRSKICSVRDWAFKAITWRDQCIIALSALMGRRMTLLAFLRSTMRTSGDEASSFFSRRQMKESDSRVCHDNRVSERRKESAMRVGWHRTQELKLMAAGVTPRLLSWSSSWNLMGNAGAMVNVVRSAARDQEGIVANSPKVAVR